MISGCGGSRSSPGAPPGGSRGAGGAAGRLGRGVGRRLALLPGGSIGGQQALEWAVEYPDFVEKAVPVAATGALGPQGVGMSEIGRRAIMADPDWQEGSYYGTGKTPEDEIGRAAE